MQAFYCLESSVLKQDSVTLWTPRFIRPWPHRFGPAQALYSVSSLQLVQVGFIFHVSLITIFPRSEKCAFIRRTKKKRTASTTSVDDSILLVFCRNNETDINSLKNTCDYFCLSFVLLVMHPTDGQTESISLSDKAVSISFSQFTSGSFTERFSYSGLQRLWFKGDSHYYNISYLIMSCSKVTDDDLPSSFKKASQLQRHSSEAATYQYTDPLRCRAKTE